MKKILFALFLIGLFIYLLFPDILGFYILGSVIFILLGIIIIIILGIKIIKWIFNIKR